MTPPAGDIERRLLNYTRTAAYLGVSVRTAKQWAADGVLPKTVLGQRVLFDKAELDAFIELKKRDR